jgi:spore maturation protein CgeB
MRFVFFTHSLVSDWNHGNAHFLRGVMRELQARGHATIGLEPRGGWSRTNLLRDQGEAAADRFLADFPGLTARCYEPGGPLEASVADADVVIVHEWTEAFVVAALGRLRRRGGRFVLLFHDTHHRAVSADRAIAALDLGDYDGVLAFGEALRERYLAAGWGRQVFTWHEAADIRLFRPHREVTPDRDVVWIGNWGDDERSAELDEFLIGPVRALGLSGTVHGVRYPPKALSTLAAAGLDYRGWIANADVPAAFAHHRFTVHIPRRPYLTHLPGIPTIRVFEALAAGIPLLSAPWNDCEGLFTPGVDFLMVRNGSEMQASMARLREDAELRAALAAAGHASVMARHTCGHRVDQLLGIINALTQQPSELVS